MVRPRKIELMDGELLTWPVQVFSVIALMVACFVFVVLSVTASLYILDPEHGDGRDEFINDVKYQQQFKSK